MLITSLNVIRLHEILPKMSNSTGAWATITIIGTILRVLCESRYHLNSSSSILILSNAMWTRSPISQTQNGPENEANSWAIRFIISKLLLTSWCYKKNENENWEFSKSMTIKALLFKSKSNIKSNIFTSLISIASKILHIAAMYTTHNIDKMICQKSEKARANLETKWKMKTDHYYFSRIWWMNDVERNQNWTVSHPNAIGRIWTMVWLYFFDFSYPPKTLEWYSTRSWCHRSVEIASSVLRFQSI